MLDDLRRLSAELQELRDTLRARVQSLRDDRLQLRASRERLSHEIDNARMLRECAIQNCSASRVQ